jgi:serine/threonine-protein kinase
MADSGQDRNLLTGILALQMDFISREQLIAAMQEWLLNKHARLEDILLARQSLRRDTHEFLVAMVAKHLEVHGGDAEKSLAAISSLTSVQRDLHVLQDDEVAATLNRANLAHVESGAATVACEPPQHDSGGRFRVLRPHARGGLGQVSVAEDTELHREVALKEIQPKYAEDETSRHRFLVEAEVTGRLEHPSIVPVYSLGQFDDGRPFYVMRFIRGDSLQEAIAELHDPARSNRTPHAWLLELRKLLRRFHDVCNAVDYAHSRGILHRDLKPGNIMLGKYGETLVVDWGLAKIAEPAAADSQVSESRLEPHSGDSSSATMAGSAVGTPAYMSPEQAEGRLDLLGPTTDVYSLGATLYCLFTNRAPFSKENREDLFARIRRGEFPPPRTINPRVPRPLEAICLKAMACKQADRYPTPHCLAEDIERWLADEPVSVYRDPWTDRALRAMRRHRTTVVGIGVLVTTALIGLAVISSVTSRKNGELRIERDRANENLRLAEQERGRAESNLATSRKLTLDLLDLAESELSKLKGKELVRRQMTERLTALFRDFYKQKPTDPQLRLELAQVIRMEASIARLMGEPVTANVGYAESIHLLEQLLTESPNDRLVSDRLAETLRDHANVLKRQGQLEATASAFARARELALALVKAAPAEQNYRRTVATLDVDLADLQFQLGKTEEALQGARAAAAVFREFSVGGSQYPADPILWLLASCREGDLLLDLERYAEAETVYRDATDRARQRLAAAATERGTQLLLARALLGMAKVKMRSGDSAAPAAPLLDEALAIVQKLVEEFPNTAHYPRYLATAWNAHGEYLVRLQDAAAADDFERAAQILAAPAAKPDADIGDLEILAESLARLGEAARAQQKFDLSRAKFTAAIEVLTRLTTLAPRHQPAQRKLQRIHHSLQALDTETSVPPPTN